MGELWGMAGKTVKRNSGKNPGFFRRSIVIGGALIAIDVLHHLVVTS
jgi:hypothetical protein